MRYDSNDQSFGALRWRKSSFSLNGECVEVAEFQDGVAVRNSNDPDAGTLVFSRAAMASWIKALKAAEFDHLIA